MSGRTVVFSVVGLVVSAVLFALTYSALQAGPGTFVALIVGFLFAGCIALGFSWGFGKLGLLFFDARLRGIAIHQDHELAVLKLELEHAARPQLPAPAQKQQVYELNPNDIPTSAVNLILFSIALLGRDGNRIASGPECAAATNMVG